MGLDQYLIKKTYVQNWEHTAPENINHITIIRNGEIRKDIKPERISYIIEEIAYWRKVNHIHAWMVNNIQDGEDDCSEYYINREKLQELIDTCKKVKESLIKSGLKTIKIKSGWKSNEQGESEEIYDDVEVFDDTSLAEELLPTQSGFFFGGVQYDKYYLNSLDYTINTLEPLLEDEESEYYYSSSW